jgi:hypothetical protein
MSNDPNPTAAVPGPEAEDDGLLDQVSDVVDELLASDIAPQVDEEDPWERRMRRLDSWTAIILAVAAVATAWATFQASQWAGAQSDAQSASAISRSDAGRASTDATRAEVIDSQTWLSWVSAVAAKDAPKARFLRQRFSPELAKAQDAWLGQVPLDAQGIPTVVPPGTPLTTPEYVIPAQEASDAAAAKAEQDLADADVAASYSTKFVLLAVLLALVLFFASIATKFAAPKIQVVLILISLILLAICVIRMLVLPQLIW